MRRSNSSGFSMPAERLPLLAVKQNLATQRYVDHTLSLAGEVSQREERRIKTSLPLSELPTGQTARHREKPA